MTGSHSATNNYSDSPFVGREPELAALREALASALDGHGRIMLVTGEPGIGKTRTSEEILAVAREGGAEVLWGRCQEWEGAPAYWPWLQILRRYVERTREETIDTDLTGIADGEDIVACGQREQRLGASCPSHFFSIALEILRGFINPPEHI